MTGHDILEDWIKEKFKPTQFYSESVSFNSIRLYRISFCCSGLVGVDSGFSGGAEQYGFFQADHRVFILGTKVTVGNQFFDMASPTFFNDFEVCLGRG